MLLNDVLILYNEVTMGKLDKILTIILSGASDNNIPFSDLRHILKALGFNERIG